MLIKPLESLGEPRSEKATSDIRKPASLVSSGKHNSPEADGSQKPLQTSHVLSAEASGFARCCQRSSEDEASAPSLPSKFKTSTSHWQNGHVNSLLERAVKCSFQASSPCHVGEN